MSADFAAAIPLAGALVLLGLAIAFARAVRGTGPSTLRRVLLPAAFFLVATLLVLGVPMLIDMSLPDVLQAAAIGLFWLTVPALLSAWILDGIAMVLGAERTAFWQAAGIVAAILATYAWLAAFSGGFIFTLGPLAFVPALVAAGAAITWWPYLPRPEGEADGEDEETAGRFD